MPRRGSVDGDKPVLRRLVPRARDGKFRGGHAERPRRSIVDPHIIALAADDGDNMRGAAEVLLGQAIPRKGRQVGDAQGRLALRQGGVERLARGRGARRLVHRHADVEPSQAVGHEQVVHRAAAQSQRQHRRPASVLERGVEKSRPSAEPVNRRFPVRAAVERRGDAGVSQDVAESAGIALDAADAIVAIEYPWKTSRQRKRFVRLVEKVSASRSVALARFRHALADERLELALLGHDGASRSADARMPPHADAGPNGPITHLVDGSGRDGALLCSLTAPGAAGRQEFGDESLAA